MHFNTAQQLTTRYPERQQLQAAVNALAASSRTRNHTANSGFSQRNRAPTELERSRPDSAQPGPYQPADQHQLGRCATARSAAAQCVVDTQSEIRFERARTSQRVMARQRRAASVSTTATLHRSSRRHRAVTAGGMSDDRRRHRPAGYQAGVRAMPRLAPMLLVDGRSRSSRPIEPDDQGA